MDKHTFKSAAEAAGSLAGDENIQESVQEEINRSRVVNALLQMRLKRGMTQKNLAELMNCTPSKISRMEAGNDDSLKLHDVRDYVLALNIGMAIVFEDQSIPLAEQIKQNVFSIHDKLERLVELAEQVNDDTEIINKINQFYGEVLFNFMKKFQASHSRLCMVLSPDSSEKNAAAAKKMVEHCDTEICL
jgi:transcriptional regulator with XRE-family HTH domain